ncbi:MAG: hypothetical protein NG784_07575 [Candidatus Jettenia sp.]|nr:hypothetical protein [Candidatus Jettenia sp.]
MREIFMLDHQSRYSFLSSLLQQSMVDDVEGAFPKTILSFLKDIWFQLSGKKFSEIFAASHEGLWVSHHTVLKLDPETGIFGKRIRARNSQSELLLALFKNIVAQFKFSPFFPDSVKGDLQLTPLKIKDPNIGGIAYGITDSFHLDVEGDYPIEFLVYLGDGRSLRDLRRMIEVNADIRALKDMFGYLADDSSTIFPLIPYEKIEHHKGCLSLTIKKTILDETYLLKVTMKGLERTAPEDLEIREDEHLEVFSYFVLDEVESYLNKGDKGWDLLKQITKKGPDWFEEKQLRLRHFSENAQEIKVIPTSEKYKILSLPPHYKKYCDFYKKDIEIVEILIPVYKIIPLKSGASFRIDIEFTVETTRERFRPKPLKLSDIFQKRTLEFIHLLQDAKSRGDLIEEKIMSLLNMLEIAYRSLSFLIMDNTVVAGAFNYLTYFGRDTVFTHVLLKPFLQILTQQKMVQQLLNRANQQGEAAHEIDSRTHRGKEDHYDYRMRDTDFLMAISTFELLNEMNDDEMKVFLNYTDSNNRYTIVSQKPDRLLNNAVVIFRNLKNVLNIINRNGLISLKRKNDPSSANWRDAVNSFSRGTYPYDVNAVWVPYLLHLLMLCKNNMHKKNIFFDFLAKTKLSFPEESFENIESFLHFGNEEIKEKIESWVTKTKKAFLITYPLDEWRIRLKNFYNEPENQDNSIQDLKKMKIGYYLREHGMGKVWFTAEEFLDDKKWEDSLRFQFQYLEERFFLPNGNPFPKVIRTYTMALDKSKKPIPILHSDLGFKAFIQSMKGERIEEELILATELPISLGGLAIIDKNGESLGFSVANPMLSDKNGYELLLTPWEKKIGVDPKSLSPWKLLGKNAYHGWGAVWEVMIDFMVAALQDTDLQNQDYLKKHYWWLLENYTRFPRVRNREVLGFKYNCDYEDWFLTEATVEKFEINDLQAFNAAGRLRVLLKSLIPGITNFWIFKQSNTVKKEAGLRADSVAEI